VTEADALRLVTERGAIMSAAGAQGTGMTAIAAGPGPAAGLIAGTGLVIAADNGATQVVAGTCADLIRAEERARQRGIVAERLSVSHAFHSPAVADARPALAMSLAGIPFTSPAHPVYSTVLGRRLAGDADLRELLAAQLTRPVLFRQAAVLLAGDCSLLVEVGPGHGLTALMRGIARVPAVALDAGTESAEGTCRTAAALFAVGAAPDLRLLSAHRFHRPFDLWQDFEFLASPCEQVPAASAAAAAPGPAVVGAAGRAGDPDLAARSRPAGPVPPGPAKDIAGLVGGLVAAAVELPPGDIRPTDLLLGDLHLNSLLVAQLAARAAADCGRAVPAAPLSLASASVGDLIAVISGLPAADPAAAAAIPAGVADWHRVLIPGFVPRASSPEPTVASRSARAMAAPRSWNIYGDGPGRKPVEALLPAAPDGTPAVLAFVPANPDDDSAAALVTAAGQAVRLGVPLTVVDHGDTSSGFLAAICADKPELSVRLIQLDGQASTAPAQAAAASILASIADAPADPGFSAVTVDGAGRRGSVSYGPWRPGETAAAPLGPGDVLLVTGGGRGIGFESALALGCRSGARVALIGRSTPDADDELRGNLSRMTVAGVTFTYEQADVSDSGSVAAAVARITAAFGPVTALIHASGVNRPASFDRLSDLDYAQHAAPKHEGLGHVLGALDPGRLRILVTYGSVIGRFGLAGEAHYALANGRLREAARAAAARLPGCWVCNVDWTAWAGAGMGERLGVLDHLIRAGVSPLPVATATELLARLIAERPAVPSVVVTGRLPQLDVAGHGDRSMPGCRYLQRLVAHTPGVELVAEASLSLTADPQLDDHRIDGTPVLPAVCALEAMAQAASALTGRPVRAVRGGRFSQPVMVPDDGSRTVRICALRRDDGDVDVVLRSDETSFAVDHFSCRVAAAAAAPPTVGPRDAPLPEHRAAQLYGTLFFHGPAFQLLRGYTQLEATGCTALLAATPGRDGAPGPDGAVSQLGAAALNDASIHVLQACVPHRRLLPVGCDSFTVHEARHGDRPAGALVLAAVERSHAGTDYSYDVIVRDPAGQPVVSWNGLHLHDIGPIAMPAGWPPLLLAPFLQRGAAPLLEVTGLRLDVRPGGGRAARRTTGPGWTAGAAGAAGAAGISLSRSHLDSVVLEASAADPVTCDWEPVVHPDRLPDLRRVVPWADQADLLRRLTDETDESVLTRMWAARECLWKAGRTAPGPLVVQGAYEQGWVLFRAGTDSIASAVLRIEGEPDPVAVAILARETSCRAISSTAIS
jgi:enediyne polyketide synthase